MVNLKNLPREVFQDDLSRKAKFYIGIGLESTKESDTANIYRFSRGISSKYNLGGEESYNYCELSYNKSYQTIFFKFFKVKVGQKTPPWYFKITNDRNVRKISALRFARKHELNKDSYAGRYPCHEISLGGSIIGLVLVLTEKNQVE